MLVNADKLALNAPHVLNGFVSLLEMFFLSVQKAELKVLMHCMDLFFFNKQMSFT